MDRPTDYSIRKITREAIHMLEGTRESGQTKAMLAALRDSIGKPLSKTIQVWPLLFSILPEEFLGDRGDETPEERAVLNALQLYALHQQGKKENVLTREEKEYLNLGDAFRSLRNVDNAEALDRRVNQLILADTYDQLIYYLRHLLQILKAKADVKVDYGVLAEDLLWFQRGMQEKVRFRWANRYYRRVNHEGVKDEK